MKFKKRVVMSAWLMGMAAGASNAAQWDITVSNLTHGNHFTPLLLAAHDSDVHLFEVGQAASLPMQHVAECGHLSPFLATPELNAADTQVDPADGPLAPGASTSTVIMTTDTSNNHLTIVAMVLPTNDAFVGLESQRIPDQAGTYTYYLNAYDAGTEGNDEIMNPGGPGACTYTETGMIPGAPGMDADSGAVGLVAAGTPDTNTNIHIHRGVLGDAAITGDGRSDLVNTIHRWQNPVAKVVVTVTP